MNNIFDMSNELGPFKIIHIHEPVSGLKAILVIDNVAIGPSIGGIRLAPDVSVLEAVRLARAMTLKNAAAGLRHGGGKTVISADPQLSIEKKEQLIRTFANAIRNETAYIPGPDMGTDEQCMAWIHDEIQRAVGLPREIGGIPLDEIGATGYGLSHAIDVALEYCNLSIQGARVVVQGFGSVGIHAARNLVDKGAVLVGAADSRGSIYHADGLDVDELSALKAKGGALSDSQQGRKSDRDAVIDMECEIWIPAARPDVIHEGNVHRLQTKLVAQGANIPFTEKAEEILHQKGVLIIPDFIANAGGVICAAVEYHGGTESAALETIAEKIRCNTKLVLEQSVRSGIIPRKVAVDLALKRIRAAMKNRRLTLF
ncbi:MAG: Glu/Leu/Phe/Val dehydrogenase [Proteobacteria bacterium]|nr:Glu/Leu/Phe/Val dehydrogenase [Pseudomonadota bacterium]MBU1231769.1 Glu/Leu/Phe/Val dehydrogenase [Pseudomonadota bacterium]MBU1418731.1 Glu/Leu/Phe/Val dehydrogenase [Pseudomonadota bacterium]MBU1455962.1 Glu/Leu/Phe/Val dehydrogenase [Pseudomonadota bacterium]